MEKSKNYYKQELLEILTQLLEQNKTIETNLIHKDYEIALKNLTLINEKLEDYVKAFSIAKHFKM